MRPRPVLVRVCPDTHPPDERVAAWRAALGFSHDILVTPKQREGFRASFEGYHLGPVLIADMRSTAHKAFRDNALIARHSLDVIAVDLVVEGRLSGTFGGRHAAVAQGDCFVVDLLAPMKIAVSDHRVITLVTPRPSFTNRLKRRAYAGGRVLAAASPEARLLGAHLAHLFSAAPGLTPALAEAAGLASLDLVAACLGAAPMGHQSAGGAAPKPPLDLGRVQRLIAREIARPDLGADMMVRHFGVSRATLYRLMEPLGGAAAAVRRHRAAEAHRLLTTRDGAVLSADEIAVRCGFADGRSLRRALRAFYGASARDLRRAASAADDTPPVDAETSAWIDAI